MCTKACYKKLIQHGSIILSTEGKLPDHAWDKDGKGGPDDLCNSLSVLIQWWTTEGCYSKYRGANNKGIKKKDVAEKFATEMNKVSRCTRTANSVLDKIQYI